MLDPKTWTRFIGVKDGKEVRVSELLVMEIGLNNVLRGFDMLPTYPVRTSLSGGVVWVEAASHEEAVHKYLSRTI